MEAQYYQDLFTKHYNSDNAIINKTTKEIFKAELDEQFKQCWADTSTRKFFPKYWFISNKGNLLSVKKDKIVWLNQNKRKQSNKASYKFAINTENEMHIRNVEKHNLVGLVFGAESFGLAKKLLEEKGIDAFGVNSKKENKVQGHHCEHKMTNTPESIKFLTDKIHMLLENAPSYEDSDEKYFEYMEELANVVQNENPDEITVVLTGDMYDENTGIWSNTGRKDIFSTSKIKISSEIAAQLQMILNTL